MLTFLQIDCKYYFPPNISRVSTAAMPVTPHLACIDEKRRKERRGRN